ncbi:FAD-dependent monooxygenase [Streptomyces sp. WAC 00631]|uniref:FAD-dependent monooxygenase n=1 Tax=Streptomyces sp. WAC 00631 TaxID=2203201 RepID=UPI000F78720B|nr:FAD-dependent monooxygenase [Streptomyces sp. WAC 00631]MCC5035878.1 FAD-dependent monooxygenase [Streptomyces sp. WAC 00631]
MDPVIVVGAGPVGLALALALTRHDVPVLVLDEGSGAYEPRPARTTVLSPDSAAFARRLLGPSFPAAGIRWTAWRTIRRRQTPRREETGDEAPLHLPQHELVHGLRAALAASGLARIETGCRLHALEQDADGVTAYTREPAAPRPGAGTSWRGSHLVGCDGARSTVRKLLDVRFPGRTAVERHAVAALRTELPWPGEAVLYRGPRGGEALARPLPDGIWRIDWLLPPRGDLVTPEALVSRIRDTLATWCGEIPPYELLDTGVHTVHHRLARRWRSGRVFLAGDAAHLLGTLGAHELDEGLRDASNLSWKLALTRHHGAPEALLDSYQAERRLAVGARLRAADQALPLVRAAGPWPTVRRSLLPGAGRGQESLLTDGHLGRGPLGAPPGYAHSPLTPPAGEASAAVGTLPGEPVEDVPVTAPDGTAAQLRERLGGDLLVVLVAPGTGVWDRRHWLGAGLMPRLAAAVAALPVPAELLVTEDYPGAAAHTVLMVRPDGHLVAAMPGVDPAELHACADTVRGGGGSGDGAARAGDGAVPGETGTEENGGAEEDGGAAAARDGTGGGGSAGPGAPETAAPTAADGVYPARGTPR